MAELLTVAQAKLHLRIDTGFTDDDTYIATLITVAREWIEDFTHRAIGVSDFELVLDAFPQNRNYIELPMAPLKSVTYVQYTNAGAVTNTRVTFATVISFDVLILFKLSLLFEK